MRVAAVQEETKVDHYLAAMNSQSAQGASLPILRPPYLWSRGRESPQFPCANRRRNYSGQRDVQLLVRRVPRPRTKYRQRAHDDLTGAQGLVSQIGHMDSFTNQVAMSSMMGWGLGAGSKLVCFIACLNASMQVYVKFFNQMPIKQQKPRILLFTSMFIYVQEDQIRGTFTSRKYILWPAIQDFHPTHEELCHTIIITPLSGLAAAINSQVR